MLRPLTKLERASEVEAEKHCVFDKCIKQQHGTSVKSVERRTVKRDETNETNEFVPYEDEEETSKQIPEVNDPV